MFVVLKISMSGLLSDGLHDMKKLHYQNPLSRSAAAGTVGNTALVCMSTVRTSVRKWFHTLPSHPTFSEPQVFS